MPPFKRKVTLYRVSYVFILNILFNLEQVIFTVSYFSLCDYLKKKIYTQCLMFLLVLLRVRSWNRYIVHFSVWNDFTNIKFCKNMIFEKRRQR